MGLLFVFVLNLKEALHLFEQFRSEYEIVQSLGFGAEDIAVAAYPVAMSFVYEYYMLAYAEHRVHIVGVYDSRDVELVGNVA